MSDAVLDVRDLSVELGGRRVLSEVNLQVAGGELVALIGPNGAGKTTLIRSILGLIARRGGEVNAPGGIGYVPQRQDMNWDYPISIENTVLMGVRGRRSVEHYRAAAKALRRVDLAELAKRPVGQLSGGQRQRVLIARALVSEPKLLLLDEPFTGLDQPTQDMLSELFRRLADEGCAVLMSTHDLAQAIDVSDRLIMLAGSVRAAGRPDELRDPQLWMDTYSVRADSPLLRTVGLLAGEGAK